MSTLIRDYSYDSEGQTEKGLEQTFVVQQNAGKTFEHVKAVYL
jgi:hypothetical protein